MKPKLTIGTTLVALALATGVFLIVRPQTKGDPVMSPPAVGRNRIHDSHAKASAKPTASNRLSAGDEARLRALEEDGVALSDMPGTLRFLQSLPDKPEIQERRVAFIRQWAESDAPSAARWAEGLPTGGARQESLNGVALVWSNQDLDGAIRWATSLPEGDETNGVLRSVACEAARTEPLVALDLAVKLPASSENDALIQHSALQWAAVAPEDAAGWARGISDETLRERVISQVATVWGDRDPVAAASLAVSDIAPGRAQDDAVIGIVQRWAQKDPEAAAAWVESFPEGALFETAADTIAAMRHDKLQ